MSTPDHFTRGSIRWVIGIEDTCVEPPAGGSMGPLDEYDLTDHTLQWREDLERVRDLGADAVRYGVRWPRVHRGPGEFDWSELDERLTYAVQELGLTVIADLVHYGTPTWLPESFVDAAYPDYIAEFAGAFAARYRGLVDHITPLNEPLTTASFCGLRGVWPPGRTGWEGWTSVVIGIVEGVRRSITAIRESNPDALIVHVEASALYNAATRDLEANADLLRATAALPTDLLVGAVDDGHPMRKWLADHGADTAHVDSFRSDVPVIDILGVNYYPDLTPRTLVRRADGVEQETHNRWSEGLELCLEWFSNRYGLPVMLTETSIEGDEALREQWAIDSSATVGRLLGRGMDVRGYTWWPLTDFVDWSWASGGRNIEEFLLSGSSEASSSAQQYADVEKGRSAFLRRMGLFALEEGADSTFLRVPTAATRAFRSVAGDRFVAGTTRVT